jgi:hypothetical protein
MKGLLPDKVCLNSNLSPSGHSIRNASILIYNSSQRLGKPLRFSTKTNNLLQSCHLVGVFGSLRLCINVRNTDINDAVSPTSPEAWNQDVATVFHAIVLEEALDSWALWLLGA